MSCCVSASGSCCIFLVQIVPSLLCFFVVISSDPVVHVHPRRHKTPRVFVSVSFPSRRIVGVVLFFDLVVCNYDVLIPSNFSRCVSIKRVFLESFQCGVALGLLGLFFFEHIVGFVVDSLPFSRSVPSSMGRDSCFDHDYTGMTKRHISLVATVDFFPKAASICHT